jgi:hypothetical protein
VSGLRIRSPAPTTLTAVEKAKGFPEAGERKSGTEFSAVAVPVLPRGTTTTR